MPGLYRSAVGKKAVMAVTGILLYGFVLVHMIGNLKLYQGAEAMNGYGEWLRVVGTPALPHAGLLWALRLLLLAGVVLHIHAAYALTMVNRKARPVGYVKREAVVASYASRTMRWGGVLILLFVIYHLMHLTWGVAGPTFERGRPYENAVAGFGIWWISLFYIGANVALGLHLHHGLWSLFQSLGWNHPKYNHWRRWFALASALVITLGNVSFPVAVMAGVIR